MELPGVATQTSNGTCLLMFPVWTREKSNLVPEARAAAAAAAATMHTWVI